jgi:hypothetical protein
LAECTTRQPVWQAGNGVPGERSPFAGSRRPGFGPLRPDRGLHLLPFQDDSRISHSERHREISVGNRSETASSHPRFPVPRRITEDEAGETARVRAPDTRRRHRPTEKTISPSSRWRTSRRRGGIAGWWMPLDPSPTSRSSSSTDLARAAVRSCVKNRAGM